LIVLPSAKKANVGFIYIAHNVLRLCDGRIENLIINRDVSAAIAKPLLAAALID